MLFLLVNHQSKCNLFLTWCMMVSSDTVREKCEERWDGTKLPAIYVWNINKTFYVLSTKKKLLVFKKLLASEGVCTSDCTQGMFLSHIFCGSLSLTYCNCMRLYFIEIQYSSSKNMNDISDFYYGKKQVVLLNIIFFLYNNSY